MSLDNSQIKIVIQSLIEQMEKTISSSCYDVIIIKQQNGTYRSTPFEVVFSTFFLKQIQKNKLSQKLPPYKLLFYVNDRLVDGSTVIINKSGRVQFKLVNVTLMSRAKKKPLPNTSDSSDHSDEDRSNKSENISRTTILSPSKGLHQKLHEYKNEKAPVSLWQFAWLFNSKKQEPPLSPPNKKNLEIETDQSNLMTIKEEVYEGEEHSKEPMFHLSLCGNLLKKIEKKQEILKTFYEHRIQYNQFIKDPHRHINDPNLVLKIDDSIYTWELGITILITRFAYGRNLNKSQIQDIIKNKFSKGKLLSFFQLIYGGGYNITKVDMANFEEEKAKQLNWREDRALTRQLCTSKTPTTEIVKNMKLKHGKNIGKFQLDLGGDVKKVVVTMKIFLWNAQEKIVVSDIDGTITKSDILGQILGQIRYKWFHSGVTKLYTQIYKRNYKIVYLTARAIGQYEQTSKFLESVQEKKVRLPEGPLMMSPDGYVISFMREVYYKSTDKFKAQILASILETFPQPINPLYCGFGNRETDSTAYQKIDIDRSRIFCINEKSIISRDDDTEFKTTYEAMYNSIDEFFPKNEPLHCKDTDEAASDDSDGDGEIFYRAAFEEKTTIKKSHSVGHEPDQEDFEFDKLKKARSITQKRKSEYEIPYSEIQSLKEFMKEAEQNKKSEDTKSLEELKQGDKLSNQNHSKNSENDHNDKTQSSGLIHLKMQEPEHTKDTQADHQQPTTDLQEHPQTKDQKQQLQQNKSSDLKKQSVSNTKQLNQQQQQQQQKIKQAHQGKEEKGNKQTNSPLLNQPKQSS